MVWDAPYGMRMVGEKFVVKRSSYEELIIIIGVMKCGPVRKMSVAGRKSLASAVE